MNNKMILLFFISLTLILLSTVNATDINSSNTNVNNQSIITQTNQSTNTNVQTVNDNVTVNNLNTTKKIINEIDTEESITDNNESLEGWGCTSVVLHVSNTESAIAFRRDTQNKATIYIVNDSSSLRQYKISGSEFTHVVISNSGWLVGSGGGDNKAVDQQVISISRDMIKNNKITNTQINKIANLKKKIVVGHYVIKSPTGSYATIEYSQGKVAIQYGTLKSGDYLVVPNSRSLYRKGNVNSGNVMKYKNNATQAVRYLALTDTFGVNRRDITTFHYKQDYGYSYVNIYASNDDGSYVGRKTGSLVDNINFRGQTTSASSLPKGMSSKYIGKITFKYNSPYLSKVQTQINIKTNKSSVYVNDKILITATIKDKNSNVLSNVDLKLSINNDTYKLKTDKNGTINYNYIVNNSSNKTVKVAYDGSDKYLSSNITYIITPKLSNINISKITINHINNTEYSDMALITGKFTDETEKIILRYTPLYLSINGNTYKTTTNNNGEFTYEYKTTTVGKINVSATYYGNSKFSYANTDTTFNVIKKATKITFSTIKNNDNIIITGKFSDNNNNPLRYTPLIITINGKTYKTTTTDNGVFNYTYKAINGTNSIKVEYYGNARFDKTSTIMNIESNTTKKSTKITMDSNKNNENIVLNGKFTYETDSVLRYTPLIITINGKMYKTTTNENGEYNFTYLPVIGTNTIKIEYYGNARFEKTSTIQTYVVN